LNQHKAVSVDKGWEITMFASLKLMGVFVGFVFISAALMIYDAEAISVEVAKKCDALTAKAFPPRVVGNPAAGSAKGTGPDERAYYKKCVANGGKMPDPER
jgi:hypothetical protein